MVAVAAQIVHFPPQILMVRLNLGEPMAQAQDFRFQYRDLQGQFVASIPRRLPGAGPVFRNVVQAT
jgi:hypothetical protein